jgi:predicted DNA-binding ribbon-helix-helix protein
MKAALKKSEIRNLVEKLRSQMGADEAMNLGQLVQFVKKEKKVTDEVLAMEVALKVIEYLKKEEKRGMPWTVYNINGVPVIEKTVFM